MLVWTTIAWRIIWVLVALAAVWAYLRFFEWRNLYYPAKEIDSTPATFGLQYEDVNFISEDGRLLHGWWIPHPEARGTGTRTRRRWLCTGSRWAGPWRSSSRSTSRCAQ